MERAGPCDRGLEDRLMAEVNAVEIAQRDHRRRRAAEFFEIADYFHRYQAVERVLTARRKANPSWI